MSAGGCWAAGGPRRRSQMHNTGVAAGVGSVCGLLVWGLLASLLTVAPVGVGPAGAQSSALVSNVGQASTGHQSLGRDAAQAFTTGGNSGGYTVDSVDVQFVQLSDTAVFGSKVTVTINSDSGGSPGAVVDALTNPVFVATNSERNYTFAAPAGGVWLEANTTYWLVLDSDGTQQGQQPNPIHGIGRRGRRGRGRLEHRRHQHLAVRWQHRRLDLVE